MKAMRLNETAPIEENPLQEVDISRPEPGPQEVLIKVQVCGVCHTDLHTVEGDLDIPELEPFVYLEKVEFGESYQTYNLIGQNLATVNSLKINLSYNPEAYRINYTFPGEMFVQNDKIILWEDPVISNGRIEMNEILPDNAESGVIATLQFSKKSENPLNLEIDSIEAMDEQNNKVDIKYENLKEE